MLDLFRPQKVQTECEATWRPLIEKAKTTLPNPIPALKKSHAKYFIEIWNQAFASATPEERIGLAVLAYRVEVHRYAAGMLIHSSDNTRHEGIRILGYMGDETVWSLLSKLASHEEQITSQMALTALLQINEGRARREFPEQIRSLTHH
ncbi:MAG: HEAT repeat domain-containing protein [Gammaproteobacteria bacterium]|nr:HEAT repeat domain-containing protein [Gammaproteobacteria bacterium]